MFPEAIAVGDLVKNISKVQYDEFGDGTTSVVVLAIELLRDKTDLQGIQIIKLLENNLNDSYLEEEKHIGMNMPKRIENARILIANTSMDTDKIKISDSSVHIDSIAKLVGL
ncbi:unnamed protein product [Rotaria sp. Silwood2]|nr:unnamed protein product [Rotaria sp. Silwood2]CAF3245660.1 unnamed protein product [Rotaria sp. Silwood2]CAF3345655.1 unnamed protein product [Rotaria sp. Silwood2]CAF4185446.1 unnamed protein product [Rotaria sp. Silwood2]CAF4295564.1 unnamed protein product [Rotaria sp. Silwood2]